MSRILVVGASGQLARSLAEQAERYGLDAICAGRPSLDLEKPDTVSRWLKEVDPLFVINAGAATAVDLAESQKEHAFSMNCTGAATLAKVVHDQGVPLLHISTDYVFDGGGGAPYAEHARTNPLNVYGQSKLAGELAVLETHPGAVICRTSWIFSPWPKNFALTMLELAKHRDEISVVSDQRGKPTYAPDLADALLEIGILAKNTGHDRLPRRLHVANSGETNWFEFASAIFEHCERAGLKIPRVKPTPTSEFPLPARRPLDSRLDCSLLERLLKRPMPHWRSGLEAWATRVI